MSPRRVHPARRPPRPSAIHSRRLSSRCRGNSQPRRWMPSRSPPTVEGVHSSATQIAGSSIRSPSGRRPAAFSDGSLSRQKEVSSRSRRFSRWQTRRRYCGNLEAARCTQPSLESGSTVDKSSSDALANSAAGAGAPVNKLPPSGTVAVFSCATTSSSLAFCVNSTGRRRSGWGRPRASASLAFARSAGMHSSPTGRQTPVKCRMSPVAGGCGTPSAFRAP